MNKNDKTIKWSPINLDIEWAPDQKNVFKNGRGFKYIIEKISINIISFFFKVSPKIKVFEFKTL